MSVRFDRAEKTDIFVNFETPVIIRNRIMFVRPLNWP